MGCSHLWEPAFPFPGSIYAEVNGCYIAEKMQASDAELDQLNLGAPSNPTPHNAKELRKPHSIK